MTRATKTKVLEILVVIGVILECIGLYKMVESLLGGTEIKGVGYLVGGFVVGIPSAIVRVYLKSNPDTSLNKDKVAVETLARAYDNKRATSGRKR